MKTLNWKVIVTAVVCVFLTTACSKKLMPPEIETSGNVSEGEFTADGGPDLDIDLGAVEGGFIFFLNEGHATVDHRLADHAFGLDPEGLVIDVLFAKAVGGM